MRASLTRTNTARGSGILAGQVQSSAGSTPAKGSKLNEGRTMNSTFKKRVGMTLIELVVVITIMALLAMLVVPLVSGTVEEAPKQATQANMVQLRDIIMNVYRPDMNKLLPRPTNSSPRPHEPQLRYLFVNPETEDTTKDFNPLYKLGWRGPYLLTTGARYRDPADIVAGTFVLASSSETPAQCFDRYGFTTTFGEAGDPTIKDGWSRPIVIQEYVDGGIPKARLRSAGLDGFLGNSDDITLELY